MSAAQWFYAGLSVLIPLVLYLCVRAYRAAERGRLGNAGIKYAIDHLPMGILFCRDDGLVLLANEAMQALCRRLMKKSLINGKDFHAFLFRNASGGDFTVSGTEDDFLLVAGDEAWTVQRREAGDGKQRVFQMIAYDIGQLYERENALKRQVESLHEKQEHLKHYREQAGILAENEAYLAAKERIHDSLGQVLLATRYFLTEPDARLKAPELIALWEKTIDDLSEALGNGSMPAGRASVLKPLQEVAGALGVKLVVSGKPPAEDIRLNRLIVSCARVCIINAVRHGGADEITLEFEEVRADGTLLFRIGNNGRTQDTVEEGGGLKSMRSNVEKEGGTVEYETSPRFTAIIAVPVSGAEEACAD